MYGLLYSLCASISYSITIITTKFLTKKGTTSHLDIYAYLSFVIAGVISFILLLANKKKAIMVCSDNTLLLYIFIIATMLISMRYFILKAVDNKLKLSNITLFINFAVVFVAILSFIIFKETLSLKNILGIIIALIGFYLIV